METEENEWEALVGVKSLNTALPSIAVDDDDDEYDDTYDAQDVDLNADMTLDETARNQNIAMVSTFQFFYQFFILLKDFSFSESGR